VLPAQVVSRLAELRKECRRGAERGAQH
jgi:hypothetical protein